MHFYYGTMKSSKTAHILMRAYNYKSAGIPVLLAKPSVDTRTKKMWSRIGLEEPCVTTEQLFEMPEKEIKKNRVIMVDEAQFLVEEGVDRLAHYADNLDVEVMCYGLKSDSVGHLFPGAKRLLEVADEFHKLETICWCGEPAEFSAYVKDGKMQGNPSSIAAAMEVPDEMYHPLCRKHFFEGKWKA